MEKEQEQAKFVSFLQERLIPDLKESGQEFMAQDFEKAVSFMIAGASDRRLLKQAEERLSVLSSLVRQLTARLEKVDVAAPKRMSDCWISAIREIVPEAQFETDNDGQVIIYTNKQESE